MSNGNNKNRKGGGNGGGRGQKRKTPSSNGPNELTGVSWIMIFYGKKSNEGLTVVVSEMTA